MDKHGYTPATAAAAAADGGADDERVHEWEVGLPNLDEVTPLSHGLLPSQLLSAFSIKPLPYKTTSDVAKASEVTLSSLRRSLSDDAAIIAAMASDSAEVEEEEEEEEGEEKAAKRARLVWTPQLHKRFVDVVAHLGIMNAVPKTIMQLMNVDGLTRENVASHLQKYRLYLKRNQVGMDSGSSNCSSSSASASSAAARVNYGGSEGSCHTNNLNCHSYEFSYPQLNPYQFGSGLMQTGKHNRHHSRLRNQHVNPNYPPHVNPGDN